MSKLNQPKIRLYVSNLEQRIAPAADFAQVETSPEKYATDRIIIHADRLDGSWNDVGSSIKPLGNGFYSVVLDPQVSVVEALNYYSKQEEFLAGPDQILTIQRTPNDASYSALWGMPKIGAPLVWDTGTGSSSVIVAVIDTGVDYNHPDLAANMWKNPGEIAGNGIDDDNNGYVDDVNGYDFAANDANPMDIDGHGTHVAGTIGAVGNNGIGVAGVNWNVKIMALRFIGDDGLGYNSNAIQALNYAVAMGAKISNNSYGGSGTDSLFSSAIESVKSKGHIFVAAAGNGGSDNIGDNNDALPFYPSSYTRTNIISVAATDSSDNLASFSNFGATSVDLAAPGVSIYSTLPNNNYGYYSGTSMAAPHVAGAAALIWSIHPTWTYDQVISAILTSVDKVSSLTGKMTTGGRLNVFKAVSLNQSPVANNDSYSTNEDTQLIVSAPGVLANDTDPNTNPLTAILVSGPAHGTLALNANGSFTYTPNANYFGADSFTYRANDGSLNSNMATVSINVFSVNDPPVAINDNYTINEDTTLNGNVLTNDTDIENSVLTAYLVGGPSHGTLTLNSNGTFTYTPVSNYFGSDSFTYRSFDGTDSSNTATVTITINAVNDPPSVLNDTYSVDEDNILTGTSVLANDTDVEGSALTATLVSGPTKGTLTFNSNGTFIYTPNANLFGSDTFIYKASDGTAFSNNATVTITINPINDPPIAANDSYTINEDTTLNNNILANDSDAEGASLTAELISGPSHGTLTLNTNGVFTYIPNPNYFGSDSFTYRASDGSATSNAATVSITINAVNDPPVALNDTYSINEDNVLNGSTVLANDTDVEGSLLTATLVANPSKGILTFRSNGTFTYTPNSNYFGTDSFTYTAFDGTAASNVATVTITINPINDIPIANNDSFSTNEDTALSGNVLQNDFDVETASLGALLVSGPSHGSLVLNSNGTFTYTPAANYFGADSFVYKAFDGTAYSNEATVSLTIISVNDAPVANIDSYTTDEDATLNGNVLQNDYDVENSPLTALLVTAPTHGSLTLNTSGTFTYTPQANYFGTDSFTYKASDGSLQSNTATVYITINPINDPPVTAGDSFITNEDTLLHGNVLANDIDIDSDTLTARLISTVGHGILQFNSDGTFNYTPEPNYFGSDSFTYKINDGVADSQLATVIISVTSVNDPPLAVSESYILDEDTSLSDNVLANDSDVEGATLTVTRISGPSNGTLTINANGTFTYTPSANYFGTDSFIYKAYDGTDYSSLTTATFVVKPINDAPVAIADSYAVDEDNPLAGNVLNNDSDVDNPTLTASLVAGPTHGILTFNSNGTFNYQPEANFFGSDSFTYRSFDGSLSSSVATVTITVNPINDTPIANGDSYNINEDTTLNGSSVLANDSDVETSILTAQLVTGTSHGSLTLNSNGTFTYIPISNYFGTDSFTYQAFDGTAKSLVASVTIKIAPANDSPVAVNDSYTINEDTLLNGNVQSNDFDVDNAVLTSTLLSNVNHGTLSLGSDGTFTYTPDANYYGTDSFTYTLSDGLATSTATVTISILPVSDAPIASNDSFTLNEDTTISKNVLINDIDIEGAPLSAGLVSTTSNGTLNLLSNGTFTYTPNSNYFGTDSFTYKLSNGQLWSNLATVSLVINSVNDAPVALADTYSINEDMPLQGNVLNNDSDVETSSLMASLASSPAHGILTLSSNGSFTYTPYANYFGTDSFSYKASDGLDDSLATVTIHIASINDPPSPTDDRTTVNDGKSVLINVLSNDFDVDGNNFTLTKFTQPTIGRVVRERNSLRYYAPLNSSGLATFTYTITDSTGESSTATVFVDVKDVTKPRLQSARIYYGTNSFVDLRTLSRSILPWSGVNRVEFTFSENMQVSADDFQLRTSTGNLVPTTFHYDSTRFTATWAFDQSLDGMRLTMQLDGKGVDGVTDWGNNPLGADWTKSLAFLTGDYNGDGVVNKVDLTSIQALFNRNPAKANRWADIDGNGIVDSFDLAIAKNKVSLRLMK